VIIGLAVSLPMGWVVIGAAALALVVAYLLGGILGPSPRYRITGAEELPPNDSLQFLNLLESLVDARVNRTGELQILTNGPDFYAAILEAIRSAQRSVNLEAYVFHKGEIGRLYVEAMAERARAGVQVNFSEWTIAPIANC
jgi:cardiolipin synthase